MEFGPIHNRLDLPATFIWPVGLSTSDQVFRIRRQNQRRLQNRPRRGRVTAVRVVLLYAQDRPEEYQPAAVAVVVERWLLISP